MKLKLIGLSLIFISSLTGHASVNVLEVTQKTAENQIRHLLEPLLDKYCHDECKLMSVNVTLDVSTPEGIAPGFDDLEVKKGNELTPSSAKIKILIDDKVGPVSRSKLLDLIQQYLDTLDFPVKVDTQITHFPLPQGSEGKIAELREQVSKNFLNTTNEFLSKFCPNLCLLADFDLQTEVVNGEEAQYGASGEFIQDGDTAIKIKTLSATLLMDQTLSPDEQANILEMLKLKTNSFKRVTLVGKSMKFPHPVPMAGVMPGVIAGSLMDTNGSTGHMNGKQILEQTSKTDNKTDKTDKTENNTESNVKSQSNNTSESSNKTKSENVESNNKNEKYERIEKIERVENGDAVQAELQKFKIFGLIFACSVLALLIFIAMGSVRNSRKPDHTNVHRMIQSLAEDPTATTPSHAKASESGFKNGEISSHISKRYEIERLLEELSTIYAQQPRVAKQVFSRILTEEGVEVTAECIHLLGEGIVVEMLRDPSLQTDLTELMEYYTKNPIELQDNDKLDLLRKLHSRTVAGKLAVLGNRSSNLFDFLAEMDGLQISELVRTESLTVKSIVLTQCDTQKRAVVYAQMDPELRTQLLGELSRIDYLPRDYIFNVANALKRKRKENPKLNTEALPGSEVLISLLERTGQNLQKTIIKNLESTNPDSARTIKGKLVSVETLKYLRDGQLLEVILSLKHEELMHFLKGTSQDILKIILAKSPKELAIELEEELAQISPVSRESYHAVERKILNRMKTMSNEGQINLIETNERMFSESPRNPAFVQSVPGTPETNNSRPARVA